MKPQAKVSRVMREFKKGDLKSSSGQKVTNPKQAIAIGLSEAGISKKAKGGEMKESKAMMKKEVSFMKKKGAPKSMVKHEEAEMKGTKKMAMGGMGTSSAVKSAPQAFRSANMNVNLPTGPRGFSSTPTMGGIRGTGPNDGGTAGVRGGIKGPRPPLPQAIKRAGGGLAAGHKSADGVASKGKTKAKQIVMKGASKGMKKGGYC